MEEVIRRAQAGDRDALAELWRSYQHLLLRYFRGKGVPDPEDVASVVWIEVASGLVRFEGGEPEFRRWLFTIAARRRIDDMRSTRRRSDRLEREQQLFVAPDSSIPADVVERSDSLDTALAAIRTLPPDQAEAVLLRVLADLSVAEVAAIMGRREGAVRVLVHRGLKRLASHPGLHPRIGVTESHHGAMYPS